MSLYTSLLIALDLNQCEYFPGLVNISGQNIEELCGQTKERLPVSQLVPLNDRATIDGDSKLAVLVLLLLQVREHLLDQLPKIPDIFSNDNFCEKKSFPPSSHVVVRLHENLSQPTLPHRIVFGVELVKPS